MGIFLEHVCSSQHGPIQALQQCRAGACVCVGDTTHSCNATTTQKQNDREKRRCLNVFYEMRRTEVRSASWRLANRYGRYGRKINKIVLRIVSRLEINSGQFFTNTIDYVADWHYSCGGVLFGRADFVFFVGLRTQRAADARRHAGSR